MKIRWQDQRQLLKMLTARKFINAAKVHWSYWRARQTGKPSTVSMPYALSVEPTTACNLRCPECPSGLRNFTRPTGTLKLPLFEKLLEELKEYLLYLTLYFQGEPYLHPQFFELVQMAASRHIYVATSTNAHFLNDQNAEKTVRSGLHRLIISIDGTDQETYSQYRKEGQLDKVLEGTRNIMKWKKKLRSATPHVIFQFLVVKPNEKQIPEVYQLAKELGVDEVKLKTAQLYDYENGNPLMPEQEKYSRYKKMADGRFQLKNAYKDECWRMWHSAVMTWDGKIVPCCFDKDAQHAMGTVGQQPFRDIWKSDAYEAFRQQLFTDRSQIEMCKNCTEGSPVWANA